VKEKSRLRLLRLLCDHVCITVHYNAIIRRQLTPGWWFQVPFSLELIRHDDDPSLTVLFLGEAESINQISYGSVQNWGAPKIQWFINVYHHFHHFHWVFQPFCATFPPLANHHADRRKSAGHVDLLQSAAAAAAGRLDLGLTFRGWKGGPHQIPEICELYKRKNKLKW